MLAVLLLFGVTYVLLVIIPVPAALLRPEMTLLSVLAFLWFLWFRVAALFLCH